MTNTPHPLMKARLPIRPDHSGDRSAVAQIKSAPGQRRAEPESAGPAAEPESAVKFSLKSALSHPALAVSAIAGCVALAIPYFVPFNSGDQTGSVAGQTGGLIPELSRLVEAATNSGTGTSDSLQVSQNDYDPVLVEKVDVAGESPLSALLPSEAAAPVVSAEMLRILAQMTPEQIDALTFLMLSQQDPNAASVAAGTAAVEADKAAESAPWVGDWSAEETNPDLAAPEAVQASPANPLLKGWHVYDASADGALIRNIDDPMSAVRVTPGTVLGDLGTVREIRIESGVAKVILSGGDVIESEPGTLISTPPAAPVPRPGPPFEVSVPAGAAPDVVASQDGTVPVAAADIPVTKPGLKDQGQTVPVWQETASVPANPGGTGTSPGTDQVMLAAGGYVQVGTFKSSANAKTASEMLLSNGIAGNVRVATIDGVSYHRVIAGPFDKAELQMALTKVEDLGFKDAFVSR